MIRSFANPLAFKTSIEARIKRRAQERRTTVTRERMLLIFDRFLARIQAKFPDVATLKGGLALELRLSRARTTKDIDLRMMGSPEFLLPRLQEAGRLSLGDFLGFEVEEHQTTRRSTGTGRRTRAFASACIARWQCSATAILSGSISPSGIRSSASPILASRTCLISRCSPSQGRLTPSECARRFGGPSSFGRRTPSRRRCPIRRDTGTSRTCDSRRRTSSNGEGWRK